jgi:hypothetical protein
MTHEHKMLIRIPAARYRHCVREDGVCECHDATIMALVLGLPFIDLCGSQNISKDGTESRMKGLVTCLRRS